MSTARDIKLTSAWDIDITQQDLQLVSDMDAILQSVKIRLQFFKGEWFADESIGMPYFQEILIKNPNANFLTFLFRDEILNTVGVSAVTNINLTYDSVNRTLGVTFTAQTDFGELSETVVTK